MQWHYDLILNLIVSINKKYQIFLIKFNKYCFIKNYTSYGLSIKKKNLRQNGLKNKNCHENYFCHILETVQKA